MKDQILFIYNRPKKLNTATLIILLITVILQNFQIN
jgi:hypothetical protein